MFARPAATTDPNLLHFHIYSHFVRVHAIIFYEAPVYFSPLLSTNGGHQGEMSGKRKHATQEVGACDAGDREKMAGGGWRRRRRRQKEIRRDEVIRRGKENEGAKKLAVGGGDGRRFPSCLLFIRAFFNLIWRREGDKGETGAEDRRYLGRLE